MSIGVSGSDHPLMPVGPARGMFEMDRAVFTSCL